MNIILRQNKENFRLAVLPSGVEIASTMQNTSVNITNFGEVNMIGKPGLRTVSLSSFFPSKKYNFLQYTSGLLTPMESVEKIKSFMNGPITLIITGKITMDATIESFSYAQQDGTQDIYFTVELKEYKNPKKKTKTNITVSKKSKKVQEADTKRTKKKVESMTYTVKSGDTLTSIAKRVTGSASNYRAIANQNNISNINKISAGQKLVIKV